jgi:hypothetical protein
MAGRATRAGVALLTTWKLLSVGLRWKVSTDIVSACRATVLNDYRERCRKALELNRSGVHISLIAERFGVKSPAVNRMIRDAIADEEKAARES